MSTYTRIVNAAIGETRSKFALAAALALDIPPRGTTIGFRLEEARQAIIKAGGEPRNIKTLGEYRLTALWVQNRTSSGTVFRWVSGMSFTAHSEARAAGLSYDDFASRPRTTNELRREAGRPHGGSGPSTWSHEDRVKATRELLTDQAVAEAVFPTPETTQHKDTVRNEVTEVAERSAQLRAAIRKLSTLSSINRDEAGMLASEAELLLPAVQWLAGLVAGQSLLVEEVAEFLRSQA